jgi:hypothetical protein
MTLNAAFPLVFPDPLPFRLRVQKSLTAALKQITPANGYYSDMADFTEKGKTISRVYRGRTMFGEDDPLPMISILEEPIAPETDLAPTAGTAGRGPYDLMVQGFVDNDSNNPTDPAHMLMADVKKRLIELKQDEHLSNRVFRFGPKANTVVGVSFGGGVVRPADEVSAVAYFWLRVSFDLAEDHLNPFG